MKIRLYYTLKMLIKQIHFSILCYNEKNLDLMGLFIV